ncbi:response regulator [Microbacterium foliorum]|uniref:Transcriptional regulatory protein n=1 Tax=Microbacterium foliorum TaxID=104336 RepID=A0A0F0KGC2_9MICO|nr:response regulator [Microbacterium foliorum]AXL11275.1 response regulator [Microbacterium foliorum]KJL19175.1 Transcriptional regulatory protein DcuR [Microbacterium foliorum]
MNGIRVLVVDDDPGARALHGRFIAETPGFDLVGTAGTGAAALAQATDDVDLLLLDMRLPDISGVEVLHRLRAVDAAGPDVLVISSSRDQVTVRQALAAHVAGYLIKPFTQEVLRRRLEEYATRRSARDGVEQDRPLAQGEVDRLLATGTIRVSDRTEERPPAFSPGPTGGLPKGLADVTLARVIAALDPVTSRSASEIATACALSRATARRYLEHLVATGVIDLAHRYGKRGRPQVLYRLAPSPDA